MEHTLRMVVGCTNRKSVSAAPGLRLREHLDPFESRISSWLGRISKPSSPETPVQNLYQGEHWSIVRDIPRVASDVGVHLEIWVASAGYGLIPMTARVESYAATFTTGVKDSVARPRSVADHSEEVESWWSALANWDHQREWGPRTVTELVTLHPEQPIIIALSGSYVRALHTDLLGAAQALPDPDQLILVTGGTLTPDLLRFKVPSNARHLHALGGSRISLNARVARRIVEMTPRHSLQAGAIRDFLRAELDDQPELVRHDREPMTDEALGQFITAEAPNLDRPSASALLRRLRNSGYACEQKRFGRLYQTFSTNGDSA